VAVLGPRSPSSPLRLLIPNSLTALGMLCGYVSIMFTLRGEYQAAAFTIFIANFFDLLDGRVAKALDATSEFGAQFDSLADIVVFGVAPAILVYQAFFASWGLVGVALGTVPLLAGGFRLARFLARKKEGRSEYFEGLPMPAAANLAVAYIPLSYDLWSELRYPQLELALVLMAGALMVSSLGYETNEVLAPRRILKSWKGYVYLISVVTMIVIPTKAFLFWALGFALFGLVRHLNRRQSPSGLVAPQPTTIP
jgi:CDP-diacylglycerol---serine O-phosphatidyltransferase